MTIFLSFLRIAWPYLLAASVGFGAAWKVQGIRLDNLNNEFTEYKLEQKRLALEAEEKADQRRKETSDDYRKKLDKLKTDSDAFKRCVALGKCNGLSNDPAGIKVPSSGGIDATSPNAISVAGGSSPEVISDCAKTTLQLNQLQEDIEKQ